MNSKIELSHNRGIFKILHLSSTAGVVENLLLYKYNYPNNIFQIAFENSESFKVFKCQVGGRDIVIRHSV